MHAVKIDLDACLRCRACVDSCFVDVLRWDEQQGLPYGAYPEDCQICTYCERICPVGAIEIAPDWRSRHLPPVMSTQRRSEHVDA